MPTYKTTDGTENVTCLSADRDFEWEAKEFFEGIAALSLQKIAVACRQKMAFYGR